MNRKYNFCTIIACLIFLSLFIGCDKTNQAKSATDKTQQKEVKEENIKVALILPGNITDKSWNQRGYEGLQRAHIELNIETAFVEKISQPDQAETMADYARRGYDIVIGHGGEFQASAEQVATQFPQTLFVVNNGTVPKSNLAIIDFDYKQIGYILGYLGGRMTKTGILGFVGAEKIKLTTDLLEGYEKGLLSVRPDGKILTAWTNDWNDIAKAKEVTLLEIKQGADIIFPTMDNAVVGSLAAAREKKKKAFGIYYDAIKDWPDVVLQSAIFDISEAMLVFLRQAKEGRAVGKNYNFTLSDASIMRLGTFNPEVPEIIRKDVENLIYEITSGKLKP